MMFKYLSTLLLVAILFSGADPFKQFWYSAIRETFLSREKMSFEDCSIFSSGGHRVKWSETISATLIWAIT